LGQITAGSEYELEARRWSSESHSRALDYLEGLLARPSPGPGGMWKHQDELALGFQGRKRSPAGE
jgi:hypothetical protein